MIKYLVYVFIGGGFGSMARYLISLWIPWNTTSVPWATFTANFIACLLIGAFWMLGSRQLLDAPWRLLLITGFCGGFSTFSTFSNELFLLGEEGNWVTAASYALISMLCCWLGVFLGVWVTDQCTA